MMMIVWVNKPEEWVLKIKPIASFQNQNLFYFSKRYCWIIIVCGGDKLRISSSSSSWCCNVDTTSQSADR